MFKNLPTIPAIDAEIKTVQNAIEDCEYELAHLKARMNTLCTLRNVVQSVETHNFD